MSDVLQVDRSYEAPKTAGRQRLASATRQPWISSVRARIVALAVIPVFGFIANGISFDLNEKQVDHAFANSANSRQMIEAGLELKGALTALQGIAREFSAQPNSQLVETFDATYQLAKVDIDALGARASVNSRGLIAGLDGLLAGVQSKFSALTEEQKAFGLTPRDGIRGQLQAAGAAIDRVVTGDVAASPVDKAFIMSLMAARRLDFEYRIDRVGFVPQLFRAEIEKSRSLLQSAGLNAGQAGEIDAAITGYAQAFDAWLKNAAAVVPLLTGINSDIQLMLPQAGDLITVAREHAKKATEAQKASQAVARVAVIGIGIATAVVGLLLSWLIGQGISAPLQRLTLAMERIAGGETGIDVPGATLRNEIGSMARTVEVFKRNAEDVSRLTLEQEDARQKLDGERRQLLITTAHQFENSVAHLLDEASHATDRVTMCVGEMKTRIDDVARHAEKVQSATEQTLSNANAVSAAIGEMSRSVERISEQTSQSADFCANTSTAAGEACAAIENLATQCLEISSIVNVIREIAEQTNLLALNATIEAARAGDSGRGFAIVAEEVKNLAGQTAKEIEGIERKITSVQSATVTSVESVKRISQLAARSQDATAEIAVAVERQSLTAREISTNVAEAGRTTQAVADILVLVTGDVAAAERATGGALADVDFLKLKFDALVAQIREFLSSMKDSEFKSSVT